MGDSEDGNPSPWWNSNDGADSLVRLYDGFELGKSYYASPFWVATRQLAVAVGEAGVPGEVVGPTCSRSTRVHIAQAKRFEQFSTGISMLSACS